MPRTPDGYHRTAWRVATEAAAISGLGSRRYFPSAEGHTTASGRPYVAFEPGHGTKQVRRHYSTGGSVSWTGAAGPRRSNVAKL